jgi:hypothetical protein
MKHPYALPAHLSPDLARVRDYWEGLLRGSARMPFWDDAKLSDLPDLAGRLFLVDVFDQPERFRLNAVPDSLGGEALNGKFIEHVDLDWPFEFLRSQASATVEAAAPTWHRNEGGRAYARLLLPMWGEGRIGMLMGALHLD